MSVQSFLYRRLSRWITCEFQPQEKTRISLSNKYEIASFNDVFCHPFYWQVFNWLTQEPRLIVDCGAHCGHFSILTDLCLQSKFGRSDTKYILVEPNPYLIPMIQKNIKDANFSHRVLIQQGLLGQKVGHDTLWINSRNYLATGLHKNPHATPIDVPYVDLDSVIGNQTIDLMKIDIEGGEFEFVQFNLATLAKVRLVFIEIHQSTPIAHQQLLDSLQTIGLKPVTEAIASHGQQLMIFHNPDLQG